MSGEEPQRMTVNVHLPVDVVGDADAVLVVQPGDKLVIVYPADTTAKELDQAVAQFKAASPDDSMRNRVLFVAGVEQLAVLRAEDLT